MGGFSPHLFASLGETESRAHLVGCVSRTRQEGGSWRAGRLPEQGPSDGRASEGAAGGRQKSWWTGFR